jgi:hypothetical protein
MVYTCSQVFTVWIVQTPAICVLAVVLYDGANILGEHAATIYRVEEIRSKLTLE